MVFKKGNVPHNKNKTKKDYEPLKEVSKKLSRVAKSEKHKQKLKKAHNSLLTKKKHIEIANRPKILEANRRRIEGNKNPMKKTAAKQKIIKFMINNNPMKQFETRKKLSATNQGILLKDWKMFTKNLPYTNEFNVVFKRFIKERDGSCLLCNINFDDLKLLKRSVDIHHINYDKKLSIPQNCCALCKCCHPKTNINRKHWTNFFQSLLSERYGYKYSITNDIIMRSQKWQKK